MDELHIEDGSNDRMYFTMVPNYILNHSSAIDQALYLQMKRFAGEKNGGGYCSASKRTLLERLKIGIKALNTSLTYLVKHKWIEKIGTKKVMTAGGWQEIDVYRVNDIWKLNTDFYRGVAESAPLTKGADERTQGADERSQGAYQSATTKNIYKTNKNIGEAELRVVSDSEEPPKPKSHAKYPHSKEVFALWGKYPRVWERNTTILKAAEDIYSEIGIEEAEYVVKVWYPKHKDIEFCPQFNDPHEFLLKYAKLEAFSKKI